MTKFDIYQMVTDRIIEKLEKGTVPWRRPFQGAGAVSWKTQKEYRGINTLLLEPGEYATFKQIKEAGGKVKKGEKAHPVVFWKWLEVEDEESEEGKKKIPFLRYYSVFEINTQVEGLESKRKDLVEYEHDPIEEAEKVIQGYQEPRYTSYRGSAYYRPADDVVNVPPMSDFSKVHDYYATMFHEMIHSTGHLTRLKREGIVAVANFGSDTYSKEELVAEVGASMLCAKTGIWNKTIDNNTAYIQSWLKVLKNDKKFIISASQQAQKAVDYILGIKHHEDY